MTTTELSSITTINEFFNHKEGSEAIGTIVFLLHDFLNNQDKHDNQYNALLLYNIGNTLKFLNNLEMIYKSQTV